jgi:flavin-dependent dehydrogenase
VSDWDLIVSGGGPVGLVTGIAARQLGLSVLVLEQSSSLPIKACGEGLMPRAVSVLEQLGVSLDGAPELSGIRFHDQGTVACAPFTGTPGRALSRHELMTRLDARARQLRVEVLSGYTLRDFRCSPSGVQVSTSSPDGPREYSGRLLIGADGLRSAVRRKLGFELPAHHPPRFGAQRHYRCVPWSSWVEVHWHAQAEAYVTPLGADQVGVAVLSHGRPCRSEEWPQLFPQLMSRLGTSPSERLRGAGPLEQRSRGVLAPGVALVGDAAGYLDALTGEGLAVGFAAALALVQRFAAGELPQYPRDHRALMAGYYRSTEVLLAFARHPRWRRLAVRLLSNYPQLFSALLAVSTGCPPPASARSAALLYWLLSPRGT